MQARKEEPKTMLILTYTTLYIYESSKNSDCLFARHCSTVHTAQLGSTLSEPRRPCTPFSCHYFLIFSAQWPGG